MALASLPAAAVHAGSPPAAAQAGLPVAVRAEDAALLEAAPVGGGGFRGGGRGGGRRSDVAVKHDITLLGRFANGMGFYRFAYNGDQKLYVGVMAQDAMKVMPQVVSRDGEGYLRVDYDKMGLPFQTYEHWLESGARIPQLTPE